MPAAPTPCGDRLHTHTARDPRSHFVYELIGTEGLIRYCREERLFEIRTPRRRGFSCGTRRRTSAVSACRFSRGRSRQELPVTRQRPRRVDRQPHRNERDGVARCAAVLPVGCGIRRKEHLEIVRPEDVGLSAERLARIERHLERRYLDQKKIAGALTLVARRGQVAHLAKVGMMDLERGKPMREDTIFRIYSMSKPVTSVALMTLYEHGHFQLDDAVHKHIPAFRDLRVYEGGNHPSFATRPAERAMTSATCSRTRRG
jgi:CubicO group peptidase (beta-lactamase class C family)